MTRTIKSNYLAIVLQRARHHSGSTLSMNNDNFTIRYNKLKEVYQIRNGSLNLVVPLKNVEEKGKAASFVIDPSMVDNIFKTIVYGAGIGRAADDAIIVDLKNDVIRFEYKIDGRDYSYEDLRCEGKPYSIHF